MQMRAHDHVNFVGPCARRREAVEPRFVEHIPVRAGRPRLVIAAAAVDQNLLAVDLEQPAMDAELDLLAGDFVVVRRQPVPMLLQVGFREFRKDVGDRIDRQIGFLDPRDRRLADFEGLHRFPRVFAAYQRPLSRPPSRLSDTPVM